MRRFSDEVQLVESATVDPCCDICGVSGYEELITICSECKISSQHTYCMRVIQKSVPQPWVCDECNMLNERGLSRPVSNKNIVDSGAKSKIKSPPEKAKTKYLPPEEAIGLTSGVDKDSATRWRSVSYGLKNMLPRTNRAPVAFRTCPSKCPSVIVKANPRFGQSRLGHSMLRSSTNPNPVLSRGRETQQQFEKQYTVRKEPVGGLSPAKEFRSSVDVLAAAKIRASASQSVKLQSFINAANNICRNKGRESQDSSLKLDQYLPNGPADYTAWKGSFKIINEVAVGQCYDGLRAHPPAKVHCKAVEVSKNMPEVLQFSLFSRVDLCAGLLGGDVPDIHDIGLYIFPKADRFLSSYTCLVEYLHMRDIVMKSCIHGVDLIIFSSSLLPLGSQRVNGAYYLWGMFSKLEVKQVLETPVQEKTEVMDMEIDMVGGEEIGAIVVRSPQVPDVPPGFKLTDKFKYKNSCHAAVT